MSRLTKQLKNIAIGSYHILHLQKDWCSYIGNTPKSFLWAFLINLISVPLAVYALPMTGDPAQSLPHADHLILELIMLFLVMAIVYLLSLGHRRHHKFALIYAGITYALFIISAVLYGVEGIMRLYEHSLFAQDAPLLARGLFILTVIWMVVAISFVFKTALEIRAAMSLLMASILLFVTIAGQLLLQMTLFSAS